MTRRMNTAVFVALLVWFSPPPAQADGFFSPWAGVNFAHAPADGRGSFGLTGGAMGGGVIGGELDFGYSPSFFGTENVFGNNNVVTLMGNLIVGIPLGGTRGPGVRPYVIVGGGLIRSKIDVLALDISSNDFGIDAGGGVMGFFTDRVGLRGDLRYFRTGFGDFEFFDFESVDFWRASIGLVIR
jgi:opacity protein-like surface antigen